MGGIHYPEKSNPEKNYPDPAIGIERARVKR